MNNTKLDAYIEELKCSKEYLRFLEIKKSVEEDESIILLLRQYHELQTRAQGEAVCGEVSYDTQKQIQSVLDLLQSNDDAMEYLLAEYGLHLLLSETFKKISNAVGINLDYLES